MAFIVEIDLVFDFQLGVDPTLLFRSEVGAWPRLFPFSENFLPDSIKVVVRPPGPR